MMLVSSQQLVKHCPICGAACAQLQSFSQQIDDALPVPQFEGSNALQQKYHFMSSPLRRAAPFPLPFIFVTLELYNQARTKSLLVNSKSAVPSSPGVSVQQNLMLLRPMTQQAHLHLPEPLLGFPHLLGQPDLPGPLGPPLTRVEANLREVLLRILFFLCIFMQTFFKVQQLSRELSSLPDFQQLLSSDLLKSHPPLLRQLEIPRTSCGKRFIGKSGLHQGRGVGRLH